MDTSSIAGASQLMQASQTQQAMSIALMRKAADQQNQMADMLAQNVRNAPQPTSNRSNYNFSTYA